MSKVQIVWFRDLELWDLKSNLFTNEMFANTKFPLVELQAMLHKVKIPVLIQDTVDYKRITISGNGMGAKIRDIVKGSTIKIKQQWLVKSGNFLVSKIGARDGAFGIADASLDNAVITSDFWSFDVDNTRIDTYFLFMITTTKSFIEFAKSISSGTALKRINESKFLNAKIPLPPLEIQKEIVLKVESIKAQIKALQEEEKRLKNEIEAYIYIALGLQKPKVLARQKAFIVRFKDLTRWDTRHNQANQHTNTQIKFESLENLATYMQRGKTPIYSHIKKYPVIAQKCVQWSGLEIQKALFINPNSLANYTKERFLQDDDVLLNSTGLGTLGRVGLYRSEDNPYNIAVADGHITILRFDRQKILPKYFYHYFASSLIQDNIEEYATGSTKQKELSLTLIKQIKIPLPPLAVQEQIVMQVEALQSEIKGIDNELNALEQKRLALLKHYLSATNERERES